MKLGEEIPVEDGGATPEGCPGAIIKMFNDGEAYVVELFGRWVTLSDNGDFVDSTADTSNSFMETVGVQTVAPYQIRSAVPAIETVSDRAQPLVLMNELPDNTLEEVKNFAEFLKTKQAKTSKAS